MKKLVKILATSVGAGLLVGAGFRLGEILTSGRAVAAQPAQPVRTAAEPEGLPSVHPSSHASSLEDRISLLEKEVGNHSDRLFELRECSLRTERSLQKLLLSIDRLITPAQAAPSSSLGGNGSTPENAMPLSQ